MIFHRSRIKTVDHVLILNGNVVKRVTSTKFLGIIVDDQLKQECSVYLKNIILWMRTIHYPNTIRSHLVTIAPMASFTPKSTSKLRFALDSRNSIYIYITITNINQTTP